MDYARTLVAAAVVAATALWSAPLGAQARNRGQDRGRSRAPAGQQRAVPRRPPAARPPSPAPPRASRAMPRPRVPGRSYARPSYRSYPYRWYGPYRPGFGFYYGYPYDPYWYPDPYYGMYYGSPYPPYGYAVPPAYLSAVPEAGHGSVRLDVGMKEAEVYVDGYFAGLVDDFDGVLHELELEVGPHRIEIRAQGFETLAVDVNVDLNRTIRYRGTMRPVQPQE